MKAKAKRKTIRRSPLAQPGYFDAIVPIEVQEKPENKKQRYPFFLPISLIERVKNIVYAERLTVTGLVLEAITGAVEKYEKKHGGPYPQRAGRIQRGRPMAS
jgi:hypothetical protein